MGYSPWGRKELDTTERLLSLHLLMAQPMSHRCSLAWWELLVQCLSKQLDKQFFNRLFRDVP